MFSPATRCGVLHNSALKRMTDTAFGIIVLFGLSFVVANVWVTVGVLRSLTYTSKQKAFQCAFVWLVPVFGSIFVGCFLRLNENGELPKQGVEPQSDQGVSGPEFDRAGLSSSAES